MRASKVKCLRIAFNWLRSSLVDNFKWGIVDWHFKRYTNHFQLQSANVGGDNPFNYLKPGSWRSRQSQVPISPTSYKQFFLYKSVIGSFSVLAVCVCNFWQKVNWHKWCLLNVGEIYHSSYVRYLNRPSYSGIIHIITDDDSVKNLSEVEFLDKKIQHFGAVEITGYRDVKFWGWFPSFDVENLKKQVNRRSTKKTNVIMVKSPDDQNVEELNRFFFFFGN